MKTTRFIKNSLLIVGLLIANSISSQIINTIAGDGTAGYIGDGGQASLAEFNTMYGIATDKLGNIYIADGGNNVIRKITKSTGVVTTVAGIGTANFSGDGGQATSAELNDPTGVALDTNNNIYISDFANLRIRKVNFSTGVITTVAGNGTAGALGDGGLATSAEINYAFGVAVDDNGDIYIADGMNNKVRKVTFATGFISTIAGTGTASYTGNGSSATSATLNNPCAIALDASHNIYIADQLNSAIRKVAFGTGIITTVAGTGVSGYTGDGGQATSAKLTSPVAVSFDVNGDLYISDNNSAIRKVSTSTGVIQTYCGGATGGFSGDGGLATLAQITPYGIVNDNFGHIYISDAGNNRVREISASTTVSGAITYSGGAVNVGYAKLFRYSTGKKMAKVDSVQITSGTYTFLNAPMGSYVIFADASASLTNTAPTFADSTIYWDSAKVVVLTGLPTLTKNIKLVEVPTNSGSASVSGRITKGLGYAKMLAVGDPVGGIDVGVRKKPVKNLMEKTKTDVNGNYTFTNLPAGNYDVYVSIAGLPMTSTYSITITGNENITGEDFTADSTNIYATGTLSTGMNDFSEVKVFSVYPNPTSGLINIKLADEVSSATALTVTNMLGETVLAQSMTGVIGQTTIDISGMKTGVYFVALTYNNTTVTKKIILE